MVVKLGHYFMHRLIQLSTHVHSLNHFVRLNASARADLGWWNSFLVEWNGRSLLGQQKPDIVVQSSASEKWSCRAVVRDWFQLMWDSSWRDANIALKELLAIVLAAAVWGNTWSGKIMLFECDNTTAASDMNSGSSHQD